MKARIIRWGTAMTAVAMSLLALAWLFGSSYQVIDFLRLDGTKYLPPLEDGHQVVQTFRAPHDGLSRVDIMVEQGEASAGEVRFELMEAPNLDQVPNFTATLREVHTDVSSLGSTGMHRFEFDPVQDSGGRSFAVRLSGSGNVRYGGDSLSGAFLFLDDKPVSGDLGFVVFHATDISGLLTKVSSFRPYLLKSATFFIGIFILGAACFGWLLWMIATSDWRDNCD